MSAYSLVAVARAAAPAMTAGGSITTLTYVGSTRVVPNYNVMGVAKASLEALVRYLASDLGPREDPRECHLGGSREDGVGARDQGFLDGSGGIGRATRAAAAQHRSGRSRRRRGVSGQRSSARRHGNVLFVDSGMQVMGL